MNVKTDINLDLRNALNILKKNLIILILIPLISIFITGYVSLYYLPPIYRASATLIISKVYTMDANQYMHYEDVLMANQLVRTYKEIARSRSVCEQVMLNNHLKIPVKEFNKKISVNAINDTQLISLNVTDTDPATAARLANDIAWVFIDKIEQVMQFNNVKIIEFADVPQDPAGPKVVLYTTIAGVLGLFLALFIIIIKNLLKQTFESNEEVEKVLEIPVLASISVINSSTTTRGE